MFQIIICLHDNLEVVLRCVTFSYCVHHRNTIDPRISPSSFHRYHFTLRSPKRFLRNNCTKAFLGSHTFLQYDENYKISRVPKFFVFFSCNIQLLIAVGVITALLVRASQVTSNYSNQNYFPELRIDFSNPECVNLHASELLAEAFKSIYSALPQHSSKVSQQ